MLSKFGGIFPFLLGYPASHQGGHWRSQARCGNDQAAWPGPDDPLQRLQQTEVQKNVDELNNSWENLNDAFKDRHQKLDDADEAAQAFQDGLDRMNDYMTKAEEQVDRMPAVGSDPQTVRRQLDNLNVSTETCLESCW